MKKRSRYIPPYILGLSAEDKPHDGSSDVKLTGLSIQTLGKDEVNIEAIGSVLDAEGTGNRINISIGIGKKFRGRVVLG